jgi:hypothetical protein
MDWSTVKQGRFASGDCSKQVYLWEPTEDGLWSICEVLIKLTMIYYTQII